MKKKVKIVNISRRIHDKMKLGEVIGEEFEFLNEETLEIITAKTVGVSYIEASKANIGSHECSPSCCFAEMAEAKNQHSNVKILRWWRCRNKVWPCALLSCSSAKNSNGTVFYGCTHYELVSKESLTGESQKEN